MAAQCCKLTDVIISQCTNLWTVPQRLIDQARQMNNKQGNGKRQAVAARKLKTLSPNNNNTKNLTQNQNITINLNSNEKMRFNANHVHKIIL